MGSDDEDHTATVYGEEDIDEEDDDESEEEDHTLQNQHADEDDVDLIDDEDDEEEDDSTSSAAGEVTIPLAGIPNITTTVAPATTATTTTTPIVRSDAIVEVKKPVAFDDSRRLFQRLWTDEDEIELLQGFLDYTIQRGTNGSTHHHHDTTAFYDQIKGKLQLEFNKNQLVEKLRRLKKKYRNVLGKISSGKECVFKSPHDQATFDLSCKIWSETGATAASVPAAGDSGGIDDEEFHYPNHYPNSNTNPNFNFNLNEHNGNEIADPNCSEKKLPRSRKRSRPTAVKFEENYNQQQQYGQNLGVGASNLTSATPNLVEETVKSSLLPLFKELINNLPNGSSGNSRGLGLGLMNMNPFGGSMNFQIGDLTDDKWRKQQILELEVYSKRLELMQDQIKSRLEELRSMGN